MLKRKRLVKELEENASIFEWLELEWNRGGCVRQRSRNERWREGRLGKGEGHSGVGKRIIDGMEEEDGFAFDDGVGAGVHEFDGVVALYG